MKKALIISVLIFVPFFCSAADIRPGTDDYLIANGWTEEQLTTTMATEGRETFAATTGEAKVEDPSGDVLSRTGTHPLINNAWGDITAVEIKKDETRQCWSADFTMAADIPATSSVQANFLIYMDGDNDVTNNAPEGVRANTDKEFSIKNSEDGWSADYRWYNSAYNALTWAINKDTTSTFAFNGNKLNVCIPFAEVGADITPIWRAAVAIYDGTNTQVDVAQNTGFPPIKGETDNTVNQTSVNYLKNLLSWQTLEFFGGLVVLAGLVKLVVWLIKRKKKAGVV
ncbi:MAG: hypothetical protein WC702_02720 [Patescibacteria group bacterium]